MLEDIDKKFSDRCDALQVGINNVYEEFKKITDGSLLLQTKKQMDSIRDEFYHLKRDVFVDIKFVKKCYKFLPALNKIKDFDDESFEKLIKVLELIR